MTESPPKINDSASWHDENGFKYLLYPAKTKKPEHLIIYLHGLDSNAEGEKDFLHSMREKIPGADIISLQAPFKINVMIPGLLENPLGYSWFHLKGLKETVLSHIFNRLSIVERVEKFTRNELQKRGLKEDNLVYYGTSLGSILALQVGLSGDKPVAAVVSRSGAVLPFTKINSKPKVFLQMGEEDKLFFGSLLPDSSLKRAFSRVAKIFSLKHNRSVARLKKQGVPLTEKTYPKQGHTLDKAAWDDSVEFIVKALKLKP